MDKQKLIDAAIEEMKRDVTHGDWTAIEGLLFNLDTEILKGFLREGEDQTIEQLEAELEAMRKKIAEQLSMVGRSIQSIDPTLYDKERELEQAVIDAHLDAPTQAEPMSFNRWRGILQELAQRCPPDRWAEDDQEGPSPDTFECGYSCALMQLHAMSMLEGHCIPIDEFPVPYIVERYAEENPAEAKALLESLAKVTLQDLLAD
tara:strand:+ start:33 stop:644 length:612 start_codon:yes stop_codon:yes gene_type:complete